MLDDAQVSERWTIDLRKGGGGVLHPGPHFISFSYNNNNLTNVQPGLHGAFVYYTL